MSDGLDHFINFGCTWCGDQYIMLAVWCWTGSINDVRQLAACRTGILHGTRIFCSECNDHVLCKNRRLVVPWGRNDLADLISFNSLCFRHGQQWARAMLHLMYTQRAQLAPEGEMQPCLFDFNVRMVPWCTHRRACVCFICVEGYACRRMWW